MTQLLSIEGRTRPSQLNRETIALLKEWLGKAESGELVAVMICGVLHDGASLSASTETDEFQRMIGALEILKFRVLNRQCNP